MDSIILTWLISFVFMVLFANTLCIMFWISFMSFSLASIYVIKNFNHLNNNQS